MWAVVPIKKLEKAKARLAKVLSPEERRNLMLAMARDVLNSLSQAELLSGILLVSRTPEADALSQSFGTEKFSESPNADLALALAQASTHLTNQFKAKGVMIVPADLPLIIPQEIDEIIEKHETTTSPKVSLIPDNEKKGTNCLICSPPNIIDYIFDGKSFHPHMQAAIAKKITPTIILSPGFGLDIDTPDDLLALLQKNPTSQTASYLVKSGLALQINELKLITGN